MPDINLVRPHALPIKIAKARVHKTAHELASERGLRSHWEGEILHFDGSGLHGRIQVTGSEIRLEVSLSLLLKPLRRQLISEIEDKFERVFPEGKAGARASRPGKTSAES